MRKTLAIIALVIIFIITYILQTNFFNWFTIAGVMPNLFVILIFFISLYAGIKVGIPFGVISGLYLDIVIGKNIGTYATMFGISAVIAGLFDKRFSKDSKITMILMIIVTTAVFEIGIYMFQILRLYSYIELVPFIVKLSIEIVYNVILTIILYPLIQKGGYKLESIFKQNEVLTRYF